MAQFSELSMGSTGLSAPSSLYQDLSAKATIWLLTSLYTPDKCLKWGLDARYSTNVLQEIVSRSEDEDFFTLVQSVISLFSLHPHYCSLKWWQPKLTDSKHLKLEISVPCALADAFQRQ